MLALNATFHYLALIAVYVCYIFLYLKPRAMFLFQELIWRLNDNELRVVLSQTPRLNLNLKSPDRQEVGEEVVLGALRAYFGTFVSCSVLSTQQMNKYHFSLTKLETSASVWF